MSLQVQSIACANFRTYRFFELTNIGRITLIIGPNAAGKTNLLEGIQLTTALTSFRTVKTEYLIKHGESEGFFTSQLAGDGRNLTVSLCLNAQGRSFFLNDKKRRTAELKTLLPAIVFSPDDLLLIKGSQSLKRKDLDVLCSQISSNYRAVKKDYDKILRQRNTCIKEEYPAGVLASINEVFAKVGAQLYRLRAQVVAELIPYLQHYYAEISGDAEQINVAYIPSWFRYTCTTETYQEYEVESKEHAERRLLECITSNYEHEQQRKLSLYGPQVDRVEFYLNGHNASFYASQGQQRSLVLSYKLAQLAFLRDKLAVSPVLLLDDVMSELDSSRRLALLRNISDTTQTFITSTNLDYFTKNFLETADIVTIRREGDSEYSA